MGRPLYVLMSVFPCPFSMHYAYTFSVGHGSTCKQKVRGKVEYANKIYAMKNVCFRAV